MLIAYRTQSSETLNRFLADFKDPSSVWTQFYHSYAYTTKEITRVDDIVIMQMESLIDIIARNTLIISVCGVFLTYILGYMIWLSIMATTMMTAIFIVSKTVRQLLITIKLKIHGHKEKIDFISYTEVILILLNERQAKDVK